MNFLCGRPIGSELGNRKTNAERILMVVALDDIGERTKPLRDYGAVRRNCGRLSRDPLSRVRPLRERPDNRHRNLGN